MKAFDKVNRYCFWYKLMRLAINGLFYPAVNSLYENKSCISVNVSFNFPISSGVKQGGVSSPSLFSLFINDLGHEMYRCGIDIVGTMLS